MSKMNSSLRSAALLAFALLTAGAPLAAQQPQALDRIAAVVNEDVILQSELERAVANVRAQYASNPQQLPPDEVLRRQVMERLVLMKLQVARANETGIRVGDDELNNAVAAVAQQNNMGVDALRQRLAADGMSFQDFRNSIRDEIVVQRLRQSFAQSRIQVSEAEVDAALAQQSGGVQYHLAHILVGLPEGATAEQIATGQKKIEGVKALIDKGEIDFNAAAVRYSDSPNALEGGDLGWRSLDEIPTTFANTLRTMQPGQVVGPIRGPSGFQLLKLVETRTADQGGAAQQVTEYQARHILVRVNDVQDAAAAKAKIDTLRARITGGADFVEVAKESSEDANTKAAGGDLGWFAADAFGPDFGQQVAALQDGQVGQPFRTEAGWHIVQRVGARQTDVTDKNKRAQVRETIGRRKLEDEYNRYLQEMRGEAYVNVRDPSAAPPVAPPVAAPAPAGNGG